MPAFPAIVERTPLIFPPGNRQLSQRLRLILAETRLTRRALVSSSLCQLLVAVRVVVGLAIRIRADHALWVSSHKLRTAHRHGQLLASATGMDLILVLFAEVAVQLDHGAGCERVSSASDVSLNQSSLAAISERCSDYRSTTHSDLASQPRLVSAPSSVSASRLLIVPLRSDVRRRACAFETELAGCESMIASSRARK